MREVASIPVLRIGSFAADIVAGGGEAEVIAVFERSFYLLCRKGIVAVCLSTLGAGPLNIEVAPQGALPPWQGLVRVGMTVEASATRLRCLSGLVLNLAGAPIWSPPPWTPGDSAGVAGAQASLRRLAAPADGPLAGLAPLVFAPTSAAARTPAALAARTQVQALLNAMPAAVAERRWHSAALQAATLLVGLGPGLTPSGDDLLGGLMLALTARGELRLRDQLRDHIVDDLDALTVPVSAMHLTAAAHGLGHAAIHALLNALLSGGGDGVAPLFTDVTALGATSGWDALAGAAIGLSG